MAVLVVVDQEWAINPEVPEPLDKVMTAEDRSTQQIQLVAALAVEVAQEIRVTPGHQMLAVTQVMGFNLPSQEPLSSMPVVAAAQPETEQVVQVEQEEGQMVLVIPLFQTMPLITQAAVLVVQDLVTQQ